MYQMALLDKMAVMGDCSSCDIISISTTGSPPSYDIRSVRGTRGDTVLCLVCSSCIRVANHSYIPGKSTPTFVQLH